MVTMSTHGITLCEVKINVTKCHDTVRTISRHRQQQNTYQIKAELIASYTSIKHLDYKSVLHVFFEYAGYHPNFSCFAACIFSQFDRDMDYINHRLLLVLHCVALY